MSDFIQIQITFPDEQEAQAVSTLLVQEHLVACAQIVGPIESVYHWQGKLEKSREWLLLAKTRATQFSSIVDKVTAIHSYECPQIVGVPLIKCSPKYGFWLEEETMMTESHTEDVVASPATETSAMAPVATQQKK